MRAIVGDQAHVPDVERDWYYPMRSLRPCSIARTSTRARSNRDYLPNVTRTCNLDVRTTGNLPAAFMDPTSTKPTLVERPSVVQDQRHAKKRRRRVRRTWSHKSDPPDLDSGTTRTAQGISYSKK
jgi:hypothetical protein